MIFCGARSTSLQPTKMTYSQPVPNTLAPSLQQLMSVTLNPKVLQAETDVLLDTCFALCIWIAR